MNFIDLIIAIFLVSSLIRGAEIGAVRQIFSTIGFFGGLFLGATIEPHFAGYAHTTNSRSLLALAFTLGFALVFLGIGEYIGIVLKSKLVRFQKGDKFDRGFGSFVSASSLLIAVWLSAAILITLPFSGLQSDLRGSAVVRVLNRSLPSAPNVIAGLGRVIDPNGFPQVFIGGEPAPDQNPVLPSIGSLTPAVDKDAASVVKIRGYGCGGIVEGSGFVIAPGLIATNAHVVAGVRNPNVIDRNGTHSATPVWFDPNLDFAVLSVNNLAGKPLTVLTSISKNGTQSAVLGYPGDGPFTAKPAVVMDEFTAIGRNIYDQGNTSRNVYEIKASVIPGNSGGPLIISNGDVIGIVFAQSTEYNQVGYALTTQKVMSELHQAESNEHAVSTGSCAE